MNKIIPILYLFLVSPIISFSQIDIKENIEKLFQYKSIFQWEEGEQFIVEPSVMSFYDIKKYNPKGKGDVIKLSSLKNEIFVFKRLEERTVLCSSGKCIETIIVFEHGGQEYEVGKMLKSIKELKDNPSYFSAYANGFIYYYDFLTFKDLFLNQTLYVKLKGGHFEKIEIIDIEIGKRENPVKIVYRNSQNSVKKEYVMLSGTNSPKPESDSRIYFNLSDFISESDYEKSQIEKKQKRDEFIYNNKQNVQQFIDSISTYKGALCDNISREFDKHENIIRYRMPFFYKGINSEYIFNSYNSEMRISILKTIQNNKEKYYLSLRCTGLTVSVDGFGVSILLEDDIFIKRPNEIIDVEVGEIGYTYRALIEINQNELEQLINKKIIDYNLYIYGCKIDDLQASYIKHYAECLKNKKREE
jgi:hypothetical protein